MKSVPFLACALTTFCLACSDGDDPGGGGATSVSSGDQTSTSSSGGSGGEGGGAPLACGEGVTSARLDGGSWDTRFTISGFTGHDGEAPAVKDFAVDTDGSVIAAGAFQWFEGAPVEPLMRFTNGTWAPARTTWEIEPPPGGFSAVAVSPDGDLALAASHGSQGGEIWIDDGSGLVVVGTYSGFVRSLVWFDGRLWAGGLATFAGPTPIDGLAVYDGTGWSTAPGGITDGPVFELAVDGDELLLGGQFTEIGATPALNVASYDGSDYTAYDFEEAVLVYGLARTTSGDLYAGGAYGPFEEAGGLARYTGTGWETVGGGLAMHETRGVVTDVVAHGDVVEVTGCFTYAGGLPSAPGAIASRSVARWTGTEWQTLDDDTGGQLSSWFEPNTCGDESIDAIVDAKQQRLAYQDGRLFSGSYTAGVDGVLTQAIAVEDNGAWVAQGQSKAGIGGSIDFVAAGGSGCDVYGIGTFSHLGGTATDARVAHFDGTAWQPLPDPLPSDAYCPTIAVSPAGEVVVGCMVFPAEGDAQGALLRGNQSGITKQDISGLGPVSQVAFASDGTLFVAGGSATGFVGKVEGNAVTMIEDGFDGPVSLLDVVSPTELIVSGGFTHVGTLEAAGIARFDGTSWSALGKPPGQVLSIGHDATRVFASTYDLGEGYLLLGAFDGSAWTELASADAGLTPQSIFSFQTMRSVDDGLILAGTADLDDGSGRGALVFHDGHFTALGGGVHAIGVSGLAVTSDSVFVAGTIAEAGEGVSTVPSVGVARYLLAR